MFQTYYTYFHFKRISSPTAEVPKDLYISTPTPPWPNHTFTVQPWTLVNRSFWTMVGVWRLTPLTPHPPGWLWSRFHICPLPCMSCTPLTLRTKAVEGLVLNRAEPWCGVTPTVVHTCLSTPPQSTTCQLSVTTDDVALFHYQYLTELDNSCVVMETEG